MTKLRKVEIYHYRHSLAHPLTTVMGPVTHRPAILVCVEDSDGNRGWGEIWCNFPPDGDFHRARLALNILPSALGSITLDRPFETFDCLRRKFHRLALQAGEFGPVDQIAAGADIAVHDLVSRRNGLSLSAHLGRATTSVAAYASGIAPDLHQEQIERMRGLGYRRFKQRIGFGQDDGLPELEAAAGSLNPGERMIADANQAWTLDKARRQMDRLVNLNLAWLEEPLQADASDQDWSALAQQQAIPLAAGENLRDRCSFDAAIKTGALRVIQPDICKWGGLSGCLAVGKLAVSNGLRYCPHFLGGGVGLIASAHVLGAIGGDGWLEVDSSENPLLSHFSEGRIELQEGSFALPSGPGLGYDPDTDGAADMLHSHEIRDIVQ
ncbi:MAG: mandelate racemase/muconate lactonizing enzyme family protein [Rhizobiaceae bacterium]|nr:mandelate racemase/muconate lactonizing enzyme family protein [Rhizobiaceae bacterium]